MKKDMEKKVERIDKATDRLRVREKNSDPLKV